MLGLGSCGAPGVVAVPSPTGTLDLRQPSVADLEQFAPGGSDASSTVDKTASPPLICGGSRGGRLIDAAIVAVPDSLSQISVLHYQFSGKDGANVYFDAMRSQVPIVRDGQCKTPTANSGVLLIGFLFAFKGEPQVDASGTTTFPSGRYAGALQYNVLRYFRQGSDVYVIRIDRQNLYADIEFENAIERLMNHGTATVPIAGAHSAQPSRAEGVLQLGRYQCCLQQPSGGGSIGKWALSRDMTCPEFILSGTAYDIEIENQLPNVSAGGLVAFTTKGQPATTIPWGKHVYLVVDIFNSPNAFSCDLGRGQTTPVANALSISTSP